MKVHTLISTHFLCTFIRTCNCNISVNGEKTLTQSFFKGVMRCGGMGILRISDLSADRCADAGRAGKAGASACDGADGSVSIITSSSWSFQLVSGCASSTAASPASPSAGADSTISRSSAPSAGAVLAGFLDIFLRFFFCLTSEVLACA